VSTTPFDLIAPDYDVLWSTTENGCRQRAEVWREIDALFRRGDLILDLGCGVGDDAVHLGGLGVRVVAMDSSRRMVEIAASRGVVARHVAIEDLADVAGTFDGALSNFGSLNCVRDLDAVARQLARLIRPGSPIALCFLSRFWLEETVQALYRRELRKAFRRWSGHTTWRGLDVYYPSMRRIRRAFDPWFAFSRSTMIGDGDHRLYVFERRAS
jgi:SAM-dependent methyltransferase